MASFSRMPRYDIRNDGGGPYAIFYCDACYREFRSKPSLANTVAQDIGRQAVSGLLRKVAGNKLAESVMGEDPRYSMKMTPAQIESAWHQAQDHFRECPTCQRIVCLADFDTVSGCCQEDSPRTEEIAEARRVQAGAALKGIATAFGLGEVIKEASQAAETASRVLNHMARCPVDGLLAAPGTKFCPECGTALVQPASDACPSCGEATQGAKFCPNCGTRIELKPAATHCPSCGAEARGAKFCAECGTKLI
jgi:rubrerythrin